MVPATPAPGCWSMGSTSAPPFVLVPGRRGQSTAYSVREAPSAANTASVASFDSVARISSSTVAS